MFRSSSSFDRLLDRATSNLLLEPDWNAIMGICDAVRSGEANPKYAANCIKKKFYHENPHVVIYALEVMESCVKNCGSMIHDEVCTKAFMEELRELVKHTNDENIRKKLLEILQTWGMAFRNSKKYSIVTETLNLMTAEGWKFPPVREAEALYEADNAPDWEDGEVCHRCRVQFGIMTRQHHCRACGQAFCGKCSSKQCAIPKFGIEKEVRVCDPCYEQHAPLTSARSSPSKTLKGNGSGLPAEYLASSLAQQSRTPPAKSGKTEEELKEEEELQLAIALSQSEAQAKEEAKKRSTSQFYSGAKTSESSSHDHSASTQKQLPASDDISPELMRYLNRDYWEKKEKEKAEKKAQSCLKTEATRISSVSSAHKEETSSMTASVHPPQVLPPPLAGGATDETLDEFVTTLRTQVEIFVNRMKSNSSRGRSISNDSSVQTLFMNTMAMHSQLLRYIQDQEDGRVYYEGLQDKLTQVKDARAALDSLREEELERKRREAEEAERLRQIQMREKLEVMRQKKQEYLQYQRQLALQRMQEQEREMKLRQEQAKQHYMMMQQQYGQAVPAPGAGMYGPPQQGVPAMGPYIQQYPGPQQPYGQQPPPATTTTPGMPTMGMPPGSDPQGAFAMQGLAGALPSQGPPGTSQPLAYQPQMPPGMMQPHPPSGSAAPQDVAPQQMMTQPVQMVQNTGGQPLPAAPKQELDTQALISFD